MKRTITFTFCLLLANLSLSAQESSQGQAYYHFSLAKMHDLAENYPAAVTEFEKALEINPSSVSLRVEFARTLWKMGEIRRAVEEGEKAIELDPNTAEAHFVLGQIYFSHRSQDTMRKKAAAEFQRVLELDPRHAEALSYLGQLHFQSGEFEEAAQTFRTLRQLTPNAVRVYYYEGQALSQSGKHAEAIAILEDGLKIRDDIPDYLSLLGELYERVGQTDKAIEFYGEVQRETGDPRIARRVAEILIENERSEEAIPLLEQMVDKHPQEDDLRMSLGKALRLEQRYEEAVEVLESLAEKDRYDLEANYELALSLASLGEREKAIDRFNYLLGISDGEQIQSIFKANLAILYEESHQFEKSIDLLQEVVESNPESLDNKLRLVYALQAGEKFDQALTLANDLAREHPSNPYVLIARAQALSDVGNLDEGLEFLEGQQEHFQDRQLYFIARAQLFTRKKQFDRAEEAIRNGLEEFPESERLRYQLGAILERQDRYDEAEQQFKALLEEDPDLANVLNYLGYMLADRGVRLQEALEYLVKAVDLDPYNGAYLDSLGWAYFRLDELEKAELYLQKAHRMAGPDPVILEHLGDLYVKLGDRVKAREYYQHSISVAEEESDYDRVTRKLRDLKKVISRE